MWFVCVCIYVEQDMIHQLTCVYVFKFSIRNLIVLRNLGYFCGVHEAVYIECTFWYLETIAPRLLLERPALEHRFAMGQMQECSDCSAKQPPDKFRAARSEIYFSVSEHFSCITICHTVQSGTTKWHHIITAHPLEGLDVHISCLLFFWSVTSRWQGPPRTCIGQAPNNCKRRNTVSSEISCTCTRPR